METILEYRKGILFIRIIGNLTKENLKELEGKINKIIKEEKIKNVVLNMHYISEIDNKGINILFYIYELVNKYNGFVFITNLENKNIREKLKKMKIFKYIDEINNELDAFNLIKV